MSAIAAADAVTWRKEGSDAGRGTAMMEWRIPDFSDSGMREQIWTVDGAGSIRLELWLAAGRALDVSLTADEWGTPGD